MLDLYVDFVSYERALKWRRDRLTLDLSPTVAYALASLAVPRCIHFHSFGKACSPRRRRNRIFACVFCREGTLGRRAFGQQRRLFGVAACLFAPCPVICVVLYSSRCLSSDHALWWRDGSSSSRSAVGGLHINARLRPMCSKYYLLIESGLPIAFGDQGPSVRSTPQSNGVCRL
jgi:hypothetical protein